MKLPAAIEGRGDTESYDYYKFNAEADQHVSVEALARRLGSSLDPVLRLLDSQGRELAYSDDDEAWGPTVASCIVLPAPAIICWSCETFATKGATTISIVCESAISHS